MQNYAVDIAGGLLAYPKLSEQVRIAALPHYRMRQLCRRMTEYGKHQGDALYYTKSTALEDYGRAIGEFEDVPETQYTLLRDSVTATEFTNAVGWTKRLEDFATLSVEDITVQNLRDDMVRTLDKAVAEKLLATDLIYVPTGSFDEPSYTLITNGVISETATRNVQTWDVRNIVDLMRTTYKMPYFDGSNFVCVASTGALRGIREDVDHWIDVVKYADPQRNMNCEVGVYNNTRFIEESHVLESNLAGGLGEMVFVADDCLIEIEYGAERLEAKIAENFNRGRKIRWVWEGGFGQVWDYSTDGVARSILVTSA